MAQFDVLVAAQPLLDALIGWRLRLAPRQHGGVRPVFQPRREPRVVVAGMRGQQLQRAEGAERGHGDLLPAAAQRVVRILEVGHRPARTPCDAQRLRTTSCRIRGMRGAAEGA